jgi:5'-3' exonuclease
MGIKGFTKFVKGYYSKSVRNEWLSSYDNVYIDINACLHYVSYNAFSRENLYTKLRQFIMSIIQNINPTKRIILASDGPAPLAKLLLQRKRRLEMARKDINTETTSLNFTPGTIFMNSLKEKLKYFIDKLKIIYNVEIIADLDEPDEAEIKIKKLLHKLAEDNTEETHCVVSNDADVIVLLMNTPNIYNIFVMHKNGHNIDIINLGIMLESHTEIFGYSRRPGEDFTVLNVVLGNDYIPKINFVDFQRLWKCYSNTVKYDKEGLVTKDYKISRVFLTDLLVNIINDTPKHLINKFNIKSYRQTIYDNYIDGMLWCMHLYDSGNCNKYDYTYGYDDTPHPVGLLLALHQKEKYIIIEENFTKPFDKELYGILLIPKCAKHLLDKKYHKLMNHDKLACLYEHEECDTCKKFHDELCKLTKEYNNSDDSELKGSITKMSKQYNIHKSTHVNITLEDINIINSTYIKYKKTSM